MVGICLTVGKRAKRMPDTIVETTACPRRLTCLTDINTLSIVFLLFPLNSLYFPIFEGRALDIKLWNHL